MTIIIWIILIPFIISWLISIWAILIAIFNVWVLVKWEFKNKDNNKD